jgi:hypothetical protein
MNGYAKDDDIMDKLPHLGSTARVYSQYGGEPYFMFFYEKGNDDNNMLGTQENGSAVWY